jgi:hypothetical protein
MKALARHHTCTHLAIMFGMKTVVALFGMAGIVLGAVACSAPPSNKTELKVCTPGESGCPEERDTSKLKRGAGSSQGPTTSPDPAPAAGPAPAPVGGGGTPDSGADPVNPKALGKACSALQTCCEAMAATGWVADFCYEALNTRVESVCHSKYQEYVNDPEGLMPLECTK